MATAKDIEAGTVDASPALLLAANESRQWDRWARRERTRFYAEARKEATLRADPWKLWAKQKQVILCNRGRLEANQTVSKPKQVLTWEEMICYSLTKRTRSAESPWQRKARNWARSLASRRLAQAGQT